jgi:hypothetical protein
VPSKASFEKVEAGRGRVVGDLVRSDDTDVVLIEILIEQNVTRIVDFAAFVRLAFKLEPSWPKRDCDGGAIRNLTDSGRFLVIVGFTSGEEIFDGFFGSVSRDFDIGRRK